MEPSHNTFALRVSLAHEVLHIARHQQYEGAALWHDILNVRRDLALGGSPPSLECGKDAQRPAIGTVPVSIEVYDE